MERNVNVLRFGETDGCNAFTAAVICRNGKALKSNRVPTRIPTSVRELVYLGVVFFFKLFKLFSFFVFLVFLGAPQVVLACDFLSKRNRVIRRPTDNQCLMERATQSADKQDRILDSR